MHIAILVQSSCLLLRHDHIFLVFRLIHQVVGSGYCKIDFFTLAEDAANADGNLQLGIARNVRLMDTALDFLQLFVEHFFADIRHD